MNIEEPIKFIALFFIIFTIVFTGLLLGDYFSVPALWITIAFGSIMIILGIIFFRAD
jgi:hypothetical protein